MNSRDPGITTPTTTFAVDTFELAELLGVSERHVQRLDAAGKIGPRAIRLGRSKRYVLDGPNGIKAWLGAGAPDRREWEARRRAEGGAP